MDAIEIRELTKKYKDVTALNALSLTIRKGELFSLLGVNGAGKTTAIKMLCTLTKPTAGDALVNGISITKDPQKVKSMIAVSPQETAIAANLNVEENLALMAGLHGLSEQQTRQKITQLSETFGFQQIGRKKAGKLSGGWQRRLSIAMALICDPQILFLDEPTLGLDVLARSELWDFIRALKTKITIVLTTHYLEEAEALSDRIAVMKAGKLLSVGSTDEIKSETGTNKLEDAFIKLIREDNQ